MIYRANEKLKLLGIEGVIPGNKTIQSKEYPLTTEVYAVIRADQPENTWAVKMRDWVMTDAGQVEVAESGYVALR